MRNSDVCGDLHILVVDDNHDQAIISTLLLELHGFQVSMRSNGKECIEATQLLKPDVIITDVDMPVMDGITACNFIRQQQWGKHIVIIVVSGNVEKLQGDPAQISCFDAHFIKPVQYEYLIDTIWKTINKKSDMI